ncbi:MAG: DUF3240 family protein [Pirellulales bacterium]
MKNLTAVKRITIYADAHLEKNLLEKLAHFGAKGYTLVDARGGGSRAVVQDVFGRSPMVRIEVIANEATAQKIVDHLRRDVLGLQAVTVTAEGVSVIRGDHF